MADTEKKTAEIEAELAINNLTKACYEKGINDGLTALYAKLKAIDGCEFASFTLCLIREKIDDVMREVVYDD